MLSKNIQSLKRAAKAHSKANGCPHSEALDHVASEQGFKNWSLLMKAAAAAPVPSQPAPPPSAEEMVDWFKENHTRAVEESPWDSAEGGYLWPTVDEFGGINDILRDNFPSALEDDIDEAVANLDEDGPWMDPHFMKLQSEEARDA